MRRRCVKTIRTTGSGIFSLPQKVTRQVLHWLIVCHTIVGSLATSITEFIRLSPLPSAWTWCGFSVWMAYMYIYSAPDIMREATTMARGSTATNTFSLIQKVTYGATVIGVSIVIYVYDHLTTSIPWTPSSANNAFRKIISAITIITILELGLRWTAARIVCLIKWKNSTRIKITFNNATDIGVNIPCTMIRKNGKITNLPVMITKVAKERRQIYIQSKRQKNICLYTIQIHIKHYVYMYVCLY